MSRIPSRDLNGKCEGECRHRVFDEETNRQAAINQSGMNYNGPAETSPKWASRRNDPPGTLGGRV